MQWSSPVAGIFQPIKSIIVCRERDRRVLKEKAKRNIRRRKPPVEKRDPSRQGLSIASTAVQLKTKIKIIKTDRSHRLPAELQHAVIQTMTQHQKAKEASPQIRWGPSI